MKRLFTIPILLFCVSAMAQNGAVGKDTIHYSDTYYLYNELPYAMTQYYYNHPTDGASGLSHIAVKFRFYDTLTVYGVAVTMDTTPSSSGYTQGILPESTSFSTELLINPTPMPSNPAATNLQSVNISSFEHTYRQCKFQYEYTHYALNYYGNFEWEKEDPTPYSNVVNCYEFYFDTPTVLLPSDADSFYIGRKNIVMTFPQIKEYYGIYISGINNNLSSCIGCGWTEMSPEINNSYHTMKWGRVFPIVRLRCTPPKSISIEDLPNNEARVNLVPHIDAEQYQLAVVPPTAAPESGIVATGDSTTYLLGNILLDSSMVYARKGCRFTTANYDTLVWSDWTMVCFPAPQQPEDSSGVQVIQMDDACRVYPNPATNRLTVATEEPLVAATAISTFGTRTPVAIQGTTLDISPLPTGIYILEIVTANHQYHDKIIKR